jgi:hypothetical protein
LWRLDEGTSALAGPDNVVVAAVRATRTEKIRVARLRERFSLGCLVEAVFDCMGKQS